MLKETVNQIRGSVIASGIASIILGILFLANPIISGVSVCYFIGGLLVIAGLAKMIFCFVSDMGIAQSILGGLMMFLFGIVCIYRPDVIVGVLTIMAGIYVIADGATLLSEGIFAVRSKITGGVPVIIFSIIFMICGFYLMFAPFGFVMVIAGITLVAEGIFSLIFVGVMSKKIAEAKDQLRNK